LKRAAVLALLLLAGCAHTRTPAQVLADIDTARFVLPTDDGQVYSLAAHRGQVVVLQFFATWCVPCLAEVNQLQKLPARFPGVQVVGVAFDLDAALTLGAFRRATGVTYPLLIADDATRAGDGPFGRVPEMPTTVVIDRDGVVRSAFGGLLEDADLDRLIEAAQRPR